MSDGLPPVDEAMDDFAAELVRRRAERGLSKKQLAADMGFDPSYVSHIEGRRHRPTEDFARRAEAALDAGGALWRAWQSYEAARRRGGRVPSRDHPAPHAPGEVLVPGTSLVVEQEHAELRYVDGYFQTTVRRRLYNAGNAPVTRYLIRIAVDRYPGEPDRSNQLYREHPLTWDELRLHANCDHEPMAWRAKLDLDAFKEVWLLFENGRGRFPLYPGQRATIEYSYGAGADKWGPWFQRAIRYPTRRLSVRLDFPTSLQPAVWGVETSLTAESTPFRTPIEQREDDGRTTFEWSTDDPALHTRYRLEWRFRGTAAERRSLFLLRASERMRAAGVVQRGEPILRRKAKPFDLPKEADLARDVVDRLLNAMQRVYDMHVFGKGMGLAAPQIGIDRAAAVVQLPGEDAEPLVVLNPRIISESQDSDERYEGCLSFFDVRAMVPRPVHLEVEHVGFAGETIITTYDPPVARLVGHEIDHLYGRLYTDRMPGGFRLIPVEEYDDTGRPWV